MASRPAGLESRPHPSDLPQPRGLYRYGDVWPLYTRPAYYNVSSPWRNDRRDLDFEGRCSQVKKSGEPSEGTGKANGKWIDVARQIASELAENRVRPGEVLNVEADYIERYGVSRATLREALRLLQYLGLVEIRMGRAGGIVLREPTAENLAQILTLYLQLAGCTWRQLFEAYAEVKPLIADAAARNRTPEQAAELEAMLDEFSELSIEEQGARIPELVKAYHSMAGNPMLSLMGRVFETVALSGSQLAGTSKSDLPKAVETTRLLAEEIAAGNAARAVRIATRQGEAVNALREKRHPELLDMVITWE